MKKAISNLLTQSPAITRWAKVKPVTLQSNADPITENKFTNTISFKTPTFFDFLLLKPFILLLFDGYSVIENRVRPATDTSNMIKELHISTKASTCNFINLFIGL